MTYIIDLQVYIITKAVPLIFPKFVTRDAFYANRKIRS